MIQYHDEEWGVPSYDDRHLFEHLVLEGAQAGLNWELVLKKRDGYRKAFANYDLRKIARFDDAKIDALTQNPAIVRNRQKIANPLGLDDLNASLALEVRKEWKETKERGRVVFSEFDVQGLRLADRSVWIRRISSL